LDRNGLPLRILLEPSSVSPTLPRGVSVEVALASAQDVRGVRAALVGVDTVIHLAHMSFEIRDADHVGSIIEGARILSEAAKDAGVEKFIFLSHLGAERASAYPLFRACAIAEDRIRMSGVPFNVIRTSVIFGPGDHFTSSLAMLLAFAPGFIPLPEGGSSLLQPVWVSDVAICITWMLEDKPMLGEVYEIGGPEYLNLREIVAMVMSRMRSRRMIISARAPVLRGMSWFLSRVLRESPVDPSWLDYLAVDRTTDLDNLPREFGLEPARMEANLDYLQGVHWGWELIRRQFPSKGGV
jgi:nucleoside-diphosphate-sugar epimerase